MGKFFVDVYNYILEITEDDRQWMRKILLLGIIAIILILLGIGAKLGSTPAIFVKNEIPQKTHKRVSQVTVTEDILLYVDENNVPCGKGYPLNNMWVVTIYLDDDNHYFSTQQAAIDYISKYCLDDQ